MIVWIPFLALLLGLALWLAPSPYPKLQEGGRLLFHAALVVCLMALASDALVVTKR